MESELVAHIGEVDARRQYARRACSSMFAYCNQVLHVSEAEAYLRIEVARATRREPKLLEMLTDGRLHLTGIAKLAPHITERNREALLERATHASRRKIEELVAEVAPKPDVPAVIRQLRGPKPTSAAKLGAPLRQEGVLARDRLRLDGVPTRLEFHHIEPWARKGDLQP